MTERVIVLAEGDNVGMVKGDVRPGTELQVGGQTLSVEDAIPFGHKIALVPIAEGEPIVKFGVSIGRASEAIARGRHVHVHNVESTYINNAVDHYEH